MNWETLSIIADTVGIASFIVSVVIWFKFDRIKKDLLFQRKQYGKEQSEIKVKLMALRQNIYDDNLLSIHIISQVRTEILRFKKLYDLIITFEDKKMVRKTMHTLNTKTIAPAKLCKYLDYFIARLDKKEAS